MTGVDDLDAARGWAAREPQLPALAALVDPHALAERLGAPVQVHRLRYKPATSVHAAVTVGGRWCLFAGYGPRGAAKLRSQRVAARRRASVILEDSVERWIVAPAVADRAFGDSALAESASADTTVAYNPRRRLVRAGRSEIEGGWIAKVYAPDQRPVDDRLVTELRESGVPTPAPLTGWHPNVRRTVRQPGRPADPAADAGLVAAAIDVLTASRPTIALRRWTVTALLARVHDALRLVIDVLPGQSGVASNLLESLHRRSAVLARLPHTVVHGDLSVDQVVVGAGGAWLVDLDDCAWGPRGWDRATWIAAQVVRGADRPIPLPGPAPAAELIAAALALRAPEPFARQRVGWVQMTRTTLAFAAALLADRDGDS